MSKKEICAGKSIAYYSGFNGLEIKHIEYGINDYLYCVSGCWTAKKNWVNHRLKIYHDNRGGAFVKLHGYKIPLDECIRMGV
jgi:hypothetical protein